MSEDLISKEKAYKVLTEYYHHSHITQHIALKEALDRVPSVDIDLSDYSDRLWRKAYEQGKADAEPRKKGEWIDEGQYAEGHSEHAYYCSQCEEHYIGWRGEFNFCPNCGADMRGEDNV